MFGSLFRRRTNQAAPIPFYRPYQNDPVNHLYNLLFCDNPALFRTNDASDGPIGAVLSGATDTLERIGNDLEMESRVRILAFNRLRAMQIAVPPKRLLGTIIEVRQEGGLDVLAAFADGRLRYINQSEKLAIFEVTPPGLIEKVEELLRVSQLIVNHYGPWDGPRRAPPKGDLIRMSFLASDGLYFGEGRYAQLMQDHFALPVLKASGELLRLMVRAALEKDKNDNST